MRVVGLACLAAFLLLCAVGCGSDSPTYYDPDTTTSDSGIEDVSGGGYGDLDQIREMEYGACAGLTWGELKAESGYSGGGANPSRDHIEAAAERLERTQGWTTGPELRAAVDGCVDGYLHG